MTLLQTDIDEVLAGQQGQTSAHHFSARLIQEFQAQNNAKSVHTQVTVLQVSFADGSAWNFEMKGASFNDLLMATDGELLCGTSQKATVARAAVQGRSSAFK